MLISRLELTDICDNQVFSSIYFNESGGDVHHLLGKNSTKKQDLKIHTSLVTSINKLKLVLLQMCSC